MAIQYSIPVNNGRLDSIETTIGVSAIMRLRSGAAPANCAAADTGTVLATITLPADWMAAAAAASKAKLGTWADAAADASGTFGHFRIYDSAGTVCHMQGTAGTAATDMIVDAATVTAGQSFTVTTFTINAANT
jgi:hypothetical protein